MSLDTFARKAPRRLAVVAAVAYAVQAMAATAAHLFPYDSRHHGGARYEIRRGFGVGVDFIPGLGALRLLHGEPCRLVVTGEPSGETRVEGFDLPMDVYEKYPEVWPDKQ